MERISPGLMFMLKRNKVIISGEVQGVFFRKFVYEHAVKLGLKGYVKNTEEGSVEAVFEGEEKNVNEMVKLCKKGPREAKVKNITLIKEKFLDEKEFVRKN